MPTVVCRYKSVLSVDGFLPVLELRNVAATTLLPQHHYPLHFPSICMCVPRSIPYECQRVGDLAPVSAHAAFVQIVNSCPAPVGYFLKPALPRLPPPCAQPSQGAAAAAAPAADSCAAQG